MAREIADRLRAEMRRAILAVAPLAGPQLVLIAIVDALVLLVAVAVALGGGGEPADFYSGVVLTTNLLLGLPLLAEAIAIDRRTGSLELALSSPGAHLYFVRRMAVIVAAMAAQGTVVLVALWLTPSPDFPLPFALITNLAAALFLGAVALFWAVRLKTSGAVLMASLLTVAVFRAWFFAAPLPASPDDDFGRYALPAEAALAWAGNTAALGVGALVLFRYGTRRLQHPEAML